MIDKDTIAQMKTGAYFINTARRPLVNYDDLYHALVSNKLAGAMLAISGTSSRCHRAIAS